MSKKKGILIPLIMATANSACMSLVMCFINVGLGPHFAGALIQSFLISLVVTLPISYLLPIPLNKHIK